MITPSKIVDYSPAKKMARFVETDLGTRIYRVTSGINEAVTVAANEPSVGLFRIQEHVVTNVPKVVSERRALDDIAQRVQGANYDIEYDHETVGEMSGITQFGNVLKDLQKAIELKQNLNSIEAERKAQQGSRTPSSSPAPFRARVDRVPVLPDTPLTLGGQLERNPSLNTETRVHQTSGSLQPRTF